MSKTYTSTVTREGRWWMIDIPGIGLTQARRLSEVEEMARSLISITLDIPMSQVQFSGVAVQAAGYEHAELLRDEIAQLRKVAAEAEAKASALMREAASTMARAEIPTRDIGTLLDVSHQRVSQLIDA